MKKFNEKEADKELKKQLELATWFCPLIGGYCEHECISFRPAHKEIAPDKYEEEPLYWIVLPRCANKTLNPEQKKEIL